MDDEPWLFDGHLDLAWNAIDWKRDLSRSVAEIRAGERGRTEPGVGTNTVSLPALSQGRVAVCVATVLARLHRPGNPMFGYATPEAVHAVGQGQRHWYESAQRAGLLRLLKSKQDLIAHVETWQSAPESTPIGIILSMEGADPITTPAELDDWHAGGLRALGLTHYGQNRYGGGTATTTPLAPEAKPLLERMAALGMPLDLTHLSDEAFWQTIDLFPGRVLASHQNARALVPEQRQFDDAQLRVVIERDGVIGAAFDAWMLEPGYRRGATKPTCTLETVADHIDHVCQLAGNSRHAAIGTDLDGGFGTEQTPTDIDTIADVIRIGEILERRGYSADDRAAILHGNWLRFFSETLPD